MKKLSLLILSMSLSACFGTSLFEVPFLAQAPSIDGKISRDEWNKALLISGAGTKIDARKTQVYAAWDKQNFYLAMRSEIPPRSTPVLANNPLGPVSDDSLEAWFAPPEKERDLEAARFGMFQLISNYRGDCFQWHHNPGYGLPAKTWQADIRTGNSLHDGYWEMEIAIPAAAFGFKELKPGDWKILFVRNFRTPPGKQAPFTACNGFMNTESFADFKLKEFAGTVQNDYSELLPRLPSKFTAQGNDTLLIEAQIDGSGFTEKLAPGTSVDFAARFPAKQATASFEVKNSSGQSVFVRSFQYAPPPERIWFNPESYLVFEQKFSAGLEKAEYPDTGFKITPKKNVTLVPGRNPQEKAAYFAGSGDGLAYEGEKLPLPGAVSMWLKIDDTPAKPYRRFISTNYRSSGYLGLQETQNKFLFFAHGFKGGNKNLLTFKPVPKNEWLHVVLNLFPSRTELFLNGTKHGEIDYGFQIDPATLGNLTIGESGCGGFTLDEITVYERPLEPGEIKSFAQSEAKVTGAISWYAVLNALVLDLTCNPEKLQASELELKVTDLKNQVKFKTTVDLQKGYTDNQLRIIRQKIELGQTLPDGEYFASLHIPGSETALLEKPFQVKHYPWLHNQLGTKEILLPPFTPLKVNDRTVSCILRDYHLGGNGLPNQITAGGENILAGPIRLLVEKNGTGQAQPDGSLRFLRQTDTAVDYAAESAGEYLKMRIAGHMEFDGLLKLDMFLNTIEGKTADRIYLDIPVKKEFAQLFHAAGEHIRANPAGFPPPGKGVIWKSRSIPQINVSNFIPYLWVGDDERGISYAADWDRGWIHCEKRDAVELFRHPDGNISIRLNLINIPADMKKEHQITIALMASPVKPMPEGWRGWSDGFGFKGSRIYKCLMSNPYWGSYTTWTARYPAFEDFEYIRKLTETRNTGVIDQEFVKSWLKRLENASAQEVPWLKRSGQQFAVRHTNAAFNIMKSLYPVRDKATVYFYTCNWTNADELAEFPVFRDEWSPRVHVYKSYADYALYYFDKMLDNGMGGIYNDNAFFAANYNWATGNAYIDDRGNVHPSLGLWRIREYHKRQLTLMVERGIRPWITVHHTNANILPILGFATNTMGMEWKYGEHDFQERFSPDYIRAVNQGRQGGFFPTSLDGIIVKNPEKKNWATRTMLAALLPHEVRPTCPRQSDSGLYRKIHDLMFDFGIAEPDCSYHAYWDKAVPVKSSEPRILVSVYRRGSKMMLVCGSYGGDTTAEFTANASVQTAKNLETGESLQVSGNVIRFPIKKHDFALLELEL